jgi:hypothetical protein
MGIKMRKKKHLRVCKVKEELIGWKIYVCNEKGDVVLKAIGYDLTDELDLLADLGVVVNKEFYEKDENR